MARKSRERASSPAASGRALTTESPDPVVLFTGDGCIVAANEAARNAGTPEPGPEPAERVPPFWVNGHGRTALLTAVRERQSVVNMEVRHPGGQNTRIYWISVHRIAPIAEGRFVAVAREVTDRLSEIESVRLHYEELLATADRDGATGLLSRDRFLQLFSTELRRATEGSRQLAFLLVDLDQFRALNESLGAKTGDEVLSALGDALRSSRWGGETYGRTGPDEFGVVLPNVGRAEAIAEATRIGAVVRGVLLGDHERKADLTASIGIALYPEHGISVPDLLQAAYAAMEQAKALGGDRHRVHDPRDPERRRSGDVREQLVMIREAIEEGRFLPVFQPVQDISSGRIVSAETLARLRERDGTLLTPDKFLGAAEQFGLVTAIDRIIIASTFDALVAARSRLGPEFEIALNLSGVDFEDDKLVGDISALARRKGIRPDRVVFEITETAVLRDLPRVQSFTHALTAEGFRFALDDFGIGFSSFRYLRELPVSELKFDVSYVQNLAVQAENRVFVRGIAEICRGLGVKTIAEGVESATVLAILKELGVDRVQGFYIGHPALDLPDLRLSGTFRKVAS